MIKSADRGKATKGRIKQYELKGRFKEASEHFDALQPKNVRDISNKGIKQKMGFLKDGKRLILREANSGGKEYDGISTLEIQNIQGRLEIKIRYMQ